MGKFYVSVYEVGQAYGGPEEGGWWYSCGEPTGVVRFFTDEKAAQECAAKLRDQVANAKCEYKMGYGPQDGADPDGNGDDDYLMPGGVWGPGEFRVMITEDPPEPFPKERPYYE